MAEKNDRFFPAARTDVLLQNAIGEDVSHAHRERFFDMPLREFFPLSDINNRIAIPVAIELRKRDDSLATTVITLPLCDDLVRILHRPVERNALPQIVCQNKYGKACKYDQSDCYEAAHGIIVVTWHRKKGASEFSKEYHIPAQRSRRATLARRVHIRCP